MRRVPGLVLLFLFVLQPPLFPRIKCQGIRCRAYVPFGDFFQQVEGSRVGFCREMAACISMLLRYSGHPVSQSRLYRKICSPHRDQGVGFNTAWLETEFPARRDDLGKPFRAKVIHLHGKASAEPWSAAVLIDELGADRPPIVVFETHPAVLIAIEYVIADAGLRITRAAIFDPRRGEGLKFLRPEAFNLTEKDSKVTSALKVKILY